MGLGGDKRSGRCGTRCNKRQPLVIVLMIGEGSVVCWNCRGVRSDEFHRELKELIRVHRLMVIILLESRISREIEDGVCKKLGKQS